MRSIPSRGRSLTSTIVVFAINLVAFVKALGITSKYVNPASSSLEFSATAAEASTPRLYLFSLKYYPDCSIPTTPSATTRTETPQIENYYHTSKPARDLWKWKDQVLGDGRDFFVPKPKTLIALQEFLLDNCPSLNKTEEDECVILSNCARFEIIVVSCPKGNGNTSNTDIEKGDLPFDQQLAKELSLCLLHQRNHYYLQRRQKERPGWKSLWSAATASMNNAADRPQDVLTVTPPLPDEDKSLSSYIPFQHWDVLEGSENILPHLCRIASGMAPRPRRPDRPVLFRPFSSRDAHIVLQLKRTRESALQQQQQQRTRVALLLEFALRAGKAARNPHIVPELETLRSEYKSSSSVSSISSTEMEQSTRVADVAYMKAIVPLIEEYLQKERVSVLNVGNDIAHLRTNCLALVVQGDREEMQWMNRKLHSLILELRDHGRLVSFGSTEECVEAMKGELEAFRQRQEQKK